MMVILLAVALLQATPPAAADAERAAAEVAAAWQAERAAHPGDVRLMTNAELKQIAVCSQLFMQSAKLNQDIASLETLERAAAQSARYDEAKTLNEIRTSETQWAASDYSTVNDDCPKP